jgi:hypothetical protein
MATTLSDLNAANKTAAKAIWLQRKAQGDFDAAAAALDAAKVVTAQATTALETCIANLDPAVAAGL